MDMDVPLKVREYLIEMDLAKPGARGRLSEVQKWAVESAIKVGFKFEDWDADNRTILKIDKPKPERKIKVKSTNDVLAAAKPSHWTVVRGATKMVVTDEYGIKTVFETHHVCHRPIYACVCRDPQPPAYLKAQKVELIA